MLNNTMNAMKKLTVAGILLIGISSQSAAQSETQQVINSTGGTVVNETFSLDWSIGELALVNEMDAPDNKIHLTNGFLQPYSIHGPRKEKSFFEKSDIKIYPNPTKDLVEIDFMTLQKGRISVTIVNDAGRTVFQEEIDYNGLGQLYQVHLRNYPAAVYTFYIYLDPLDGQIRKSGAFRVMKINF